MEKQNEPRKRIIQLLLDSSLQYGETYEQRAIFDSDFEKLADCIIDITNNL